MTGKEKQALTRIIFTVILILIVALRTIKMHKDYLPAIPYTVTFTEILLCIFIIFLFLHMVRFINEAVEIFKKKENG